jgi:hypothetical protein
LARQPNSTRIHRNCRENVRPKPSLIFLRSTRSNSSTRRRITITAGSDQLGIHQKAWGDRWR